GAGDRCRIAHRRATQPCAAAARYRGAGVCRAALVVPKALPGRTAGTPRPTARQLGLGDLGGLVLRGGLAAPGRLLAGDRRQRQPEISPAIGRVGSEYRAAVLLGDLLDDRQTESTALPTLRVVAAEEAIEY